MCYKRQNVPPNRQYVTVPISHRKHPVKPGPSTSTQWQHLTPLRTDGPERCDTSASGKREAEEQKWTAIQFRPVHLDTPSVARQTAAL